MSDPSAEMEWPTGGGACGELLRRFDWSKSELGAPSTWPQYLRGHPPKKVRMAKTQLGRLDIVVAITV
jgi:hypothetical protein